jgi:glycosyltransferase involved in cell wall biosynthesis
MINPIISIITVVFNSVKTLEETILSVINQNSRDFEFIIVDGGSTDGTIEIIKRHEKCITNWISEPDNGIYDAMNKGVDLSNGQFIYFLGGDDVLTTSSIIKEISSFLRKKDKVYYGNVIFKNRNIIYDGEFNSFKIVTRNISHQSIFYPKEIWSEFRYNLKYKIFADYDLNLKLYNHHYYSFEYIPITVAIFNDEGSSGSNTIDLNFENDRLLIIKRNFPYWIYLYRKLRSCLARIFRKL